MDVANIANRLMQKGDYANIALMISTLCYVNPEKGHKFCKQLILLGITEKLCYSHDIYNIGKVIDSFRMTNDLIIKDFLSTLNFYKLIDNMKKYGNRDGIIKCIAAILHLNMDTGKDMLNYFDFKELCDKAMLPLSTQPSFDDKNLP